MSCLKRLQISHLRNLEQVSLKLSPKVNLFFGENGSGKTSLLEALSLLGLGRSFRSHKTRSLIQHNQEQLTVFAEIDAEPSHTSVGVQKNRDGNSLIRVNGKTELSAIALAQQLPLQIINASSFQLIEGSPLQRRHFLDWMVFHVKPEFVEPWRRLQRLIKQRNSLLKRDKITRLDLAPWDKEYIELTQIIHGLRKAVFEDFLTLFKGFYTGLSGVTADIEIRYQAGWAADQAFEDVLAHDFERDVRDGYTHHGPQRADLKFSVDGRPALDVLSRGQEKSLICALHIAQAQLYQQRRDKKCVFLVDDFLAELDYQSATRLANWLNELDGQVFVTGISKEALLKAWCDEPGQETEPKNNSRENNKIALFHVKQGNIHSESDSDVFNKNI